MRNSPNTTSIAMLLGMWRLVVRSRQHAGKGGFFQVISHGIPSELLEGTKAASKEFFVLRMDQVNLLECYESEHTKNVRDRKEVFGLVVELVVFR